MMLRRSASARPTRLGPLFFASLLVAGCVSTPAAENDPSATLVIDENRPAPSFGDVVTGPAVPPDLNATTAAAPRLVEGEWWRIKYTFSDIAGGAASIDLVRVVANASEQGYVFGMPHEGWVKEAIAYHAPAFGDVARNLSYQTHNEWLEPVRFPIRAGDTWNTRFAAQTLIGKVESVDEHIAEISLSTPPNTEPTAPVTNALGTTSPGGVAFRLIYDARMHEVIRMESFLGVWEVVEHGYDFAGWVTVPRGEHTAIDYGTFMPAYPGQPVLTRQVVVNGGYNRLTLMHLLGGLGPGSYRITSTAPDKTQFTTASDGTELVVKFYEVYNPDGTWTQEDFVAGPGYTYNMGIAYHQYDIRLPDGQRRADHAHPVIR